MVARGVLSDSFSNCERCTKKVFAVVQDEKRTSVVHDISRV